jgi:hypothetical protein
LAGPFALIFPHDPTLAPAKVISASLASCAK